MSYVENVIRATGGHAAPAENLEEEIPEGYHRMPDGTIMKDSEHDDEAALEKGSDDPCWEGYVQVGMKKGKDGTMVPNCVPMKASASLEKIQTVLTSDEIEEVLTYYNSAVGPARQVGITAAALVAERSYEAYSDSAESSELASAVLWELHSFLEYATLGTSEDLEIISEHEDLLVEGHPGFGITASTPSRISWAADAPDLEQSSREAIKTALSKTSSELEVIHAATRVKAMVSSGALDATTVQVITDISGN